MFRTSALVGVLLCGSLAQAADYWVRNGGSDAADGLSVGTAWNTLVHAAAVVGPGDTVHVQDGNYQGFYLSTSGTSGAPITFRAEGANVRITSNNPSTPDGINLEGASWVVIDGFIVNDRSRTGVRAVEASHVTIRNCHLGNNFKWGILTGFVDDLLIENNEAHHSQDEHGIYVGNSCNRPVVRNNVVHHNAGCGMHFNGDIFTCCGDGLIEDAVIEGNIAYENGAPHGGSAINMDGGVRAVIRNNLLYDNHASGISLYQIDGGAPATNNQIINNTIIQASDGRWAINISDGSTGNTVRNNILWNAHSFRGVISLDAASRPGFVSDYNSLMNRMSIDGGDTSMSLSAWQALGYDLHSFLAVPADHFVAPGTDFHLLASSPAIDTGVLTGAPSSDLDGAPRPVGAAIDLGAYERQLLTCGNGSPDVGEQCGEPGIGPCSDPCTACVSCTCATVAPTCGDNLICGGEACEQDADCGAGFNCVGCACVVPPTCTSGITLAKPRLTLAASPMKIALKAEATIPLPWSGIAPPANGIRIVVDGVSGPGGLDVTLPGGARWKSNASGTTWTYADSTGAVGGITRVVIQNRSSKTPGLLRVAARGRGGSPVVLPSPSSTRATLIVGTASECASYQWNGPSGAKPRCTAPTGRLLCK